MINVGGQPEPGNFDSEVRQPGANFLEKKANNPQLKFKNLWKKVSRDLHAAYGGICAYTCMYILPPGSVDHFFPKSAHPDLAYEWSNYRLASQRVNQHKGDSTEVIDPFNVQAGWFVLDFPSCLVRSGENLSALVREQVENTIRILKLNDDDTLVQERCDMMVMYTDGEVEIGFLARRYPFLADEIHRQNIEDTVADIFKSLTS
ncbi:MAG: hypothetical protein GY820_20390 [Gammaproteobacteria bacterium]|nr:hypothetical protein [Gammaproteobacteria bacterium]